MSRQKKTTAEGIGVDAWLKAYLAGGSRLGDAVIEEGAKRGFGERIIRGAKANLGIESFHRPGDKKFYWRDPTVGEPFELSRGSVSAREFEELKQTVRNLKAMVRKLVKDSELPIVHVTEEYLTSEARREWSYLALDATEEDRKEHLQEIIRYLRKEVEDNPSDVTVPDQQITTIAVMTGLEEDKKRETTMASAVATAAEANADPESVKF